jgi:hypothetical protein
MDELNNKLLMLKARQIQALEAVLAAARPLIPLLQDHNLNNSARALSEAVFQYDSVTQEAVALMEADPAAVIQAIIRSLQGGRS